MSMLRLDECISLMQMAKTFTGLKLQGAIGKFGQTDLSVLFLNLHGRILHRQHLVPETSFSETSFSETSCRETPSREMPFDETPFRDFI